MKKVLFIASLTSICQVFAGFSTLEDELYLYPHTLDARPRISYNTAKKHTVTDISYSGSLVRIEDGSHFEVSSSDSRQVRSWREGDEITFGINTSWFSSYSYILRNLTDGSCVVANLKYGPAVGSRFAKQITAIEHKTVALTDGSYWEVPRQEQITLDSWKDYEYVLIGESANPRYKYILLNVNREEYVEARPQ